MATRNISKETYLIANYVEKAIESLKLFDLVHKKHLTIEDKVYCSQWSQWLEHVFVELNEDLKSGKDHLRILEHLEHFLKVFQQQEVAQTQLEQILEENCKSEAEFKRNNLHFDEEINSLNHLICHLKDQFEWEIHRSKLILQRCKTYEENFINQLKLQLNEEISFCEEKAENLENEISGQKEKFSKDEAVLCQDIENIQQSLAELRVKFKSEKEDFFNRISESENQLLEVEQKHEELLQRYSLRKSVVDEERENQRAVQTAQEEAARFMRTVIKLQAWWKGISTRRQFLLEKQTMKSEKVLKAEKKTPAKRNPPKR